MKTHVIIPIFIPHKGCSHDCIFCNQKVITARTAEVGPEDVEPTIRRYLSTIDRSRIRSVALAFYGGSFTGLPLEEQTAFLRTADACRQAGLIDGIHLSTRPDYIDERICDNLAKHHVELVELGVQSFDPEVLRASRRGHDPEAIYRACEQIRSCGFRLGIQLMAGLPADSREKCLRSARHTAAIGPECARIYPTLVLPGTGLAGLCERGAYTPLTLEEAVSVSKDMYRILTEAGIRILRVGLKSTDLIREGGEILGGGYHPAFRQLVESAIAREDLEAQLAELLRTGRAAPDGRVTFLSAPGSISSMIGNRRCNKEYFAARYPRLAIRFTTDETVEPGRYLVVV